MAHTVFVYGTLLAEEIVQILLNRVPESHAGESFCCALLSKAAEAKGRFWSMQQRSKGTADTGFTTEFTQRFYRH